MFKQKIWVRLIVVMLFCSFGVVGIYASEESDNEEESALERGRRDEDVVRRGINFKVRAEGDTKELARRNAYIDAKQRSGGRFTVTDEQIYKEQNQWVCVLSCTD